MTCQYGNEIKWRKGKLGEWVPYFEEGTYGMKEFHTWDSETDDAKNEAGVDYQRRADPLRDFYYLSEEETLDYLHGVMGGDSVSSDRDHEYTPEEQAAIEAARQESFSSFGSNVHDDESWGDYWEANAFNDEEREGYGNRAGYVDQLQDVRQTLEFMQSYRYSENGSLKTSDFGMDESEGSREFRDVVNAGGKLGRPEWDSTVKSCTPGMGGCTSQTQLSDWTGRLSGTGDDLHKDGLEKFQKSGEMRWLTDEFFKQKDLLYKTQKAAGLSKDFDKIFGSKTVPDSTPDLYWYRQDASGEYTHSGGLFDELTPTKQGPNLENSAWALYQDNAWEFGALDTTAQLQDAIAKIEASGSSEWYGTDHYRNDDQRTYLAQKAYTRYLYSKINQLGGYDYTFGVDPNPPDAGDRAFMGSEDYDYRNSDPGRNGTSEEWRGLSWALDPMFSELDDGHDPAGSIGYGSDYDVLHRDDWEDPGYYAYAGKFGQDTDAMYNLRYYGIIGDGKEDNPDYIAGNFNDMLDYDAAMGNPENFPWDPVQERYVKMGDQTPGLVYNDDTGAYEIPDGWVPPKELTTLATLEPDDDPDVDTWGGAGFGQTVDDGFDDFGGMPIPGEDYPATFVYNSRNHTLTAPDGSTFDYPADYDDAWDYFDRLAATQAREDKEKQDAEDAAAAAQQQQDDEDTAAAEAEASATQTAPDDHPGAVHDPAPPEAEPRPSYQHYPTTVQHDIMHFAADATAPAHIPVVKTI